MAAEYRDKIVRNSRFCCLQQPDHGVRRRIKSREWQEGTEERDGIREVEMGNEQLPLSANPFIKNQIMIDFLRPKVL